MPHDTKKNFGKEMFFDKKLCTESIQGHPQDSLQCGEMTWPDVVKERKHVVVEINSDTLYIRLRNEEVRSSDECKEL